MTVEYKEEIDYKTCEVVKQAWIESFKQNINGKGGEEGKKEVKKLLEDFKEKIIKNLGTNYVEEIKINLDFTDKNFIKIYTNIYNYLKNKCGVIL